MNVAFIPVRGGSKSIPLKNIKLINGKPLVFWTIKAACECEYIDAVYVSTDSDIIKKTVEGCIANENSDIYIKLNIISRSNETATDKASTESAMLEFADKYEFDNIALIQATSPLLTFSDLNRGFKIFEDNATDSVLSVVPHKRFHWKIDDRGFAHAINYNIFDRPRRQDFEGSYVENGAFYITSKMALQKSRNRISGNIKVVEMSEETFYEIDEEKDWVIVEALMKNKFVKTKKEFSSIKMLLTDCDGCLTDGGMYYSEFGDELKKFNTRDGMAFSILHDLGIITGIVTSENVDLNKRRAIKLNIDILECGCKDKALIIKKICKEYNIALENVAYIGDDINDIDALKMVGLSCAPADAMPQIKNVVDIVTKSSGGQGVVREIAEIIKEAKNV